MPKYEVEVTREVFETITLIIDAASEDEAGERAVAESAEIDVSEWTAKVEFHNATHIEEMK